ncbi:MAG: hypothetical protein VST69_05380, partial [Nitrospirota bacterium]|nr:hypothetical protein [Nitrospirota bacterium]
MVDTYSGICHHCFMILSRYFAIIFLLVFLVFFGGKRQAVADEVESPEASRAVLDDGNISLDETIFYQDRFIFRTKNVDDLFILVFAFERGRQKEGYYGEFFGAVFEQAQWSFLEGNDKYSYASSNLETIFPSYYAKVEGSAVSGFVVTYDGGDYTLRLSSGPLQSVYSVHKGETLNKKIGITEAVVTLKGKEYWGDLVHETLSWKGFEGLDRHKGLYQDYEAFYLKTESGQQIFFHKNRADRHAFLKKYSLTDTLKSEGGVVLEGLKTVYVLKTPIALSATNRVTPPFAFYSVPERWEVPINSDCGSLFRWTRGKTSINWVFGGYLMMAIEGVIKKEGEDGEGERV